jgi:hypothetical protein
VRWFFHSSLWTNIIYFGNAFSALSRIWNWILIGRNTGTIKIHKIKQNMKKQELMLTG